MLAIHGVLALGAQQPPAAKGESPLAITNAGVQRADDDPFVAPSFQFLPGEPVYVTFQLAGFQTTAGSEKDSRKMFLTYTVAAEDLNGLPLAPPVTDKIETELNAEDKNWSPKRRASFQLPSFVAAGAYRVRVAAHDNIAHAEVSRDFPFQIGGAAVPPSNGVTIQAFQFFRTASDRQPLEVAAYQPGDPIYARFRIVGFKKGDENRYRVSYRIAVLRPDGKPFLRDTPDNNLDAKSFYPAPYVPGEIDLTTSKDSGKGQYQLLVTVRDLIAGNYGEFRTTFSLE